MQDQPTPLCVVSMCDTQLPTSPGCRQLLKLHLGSNNWPGDVARQLEGILLASRFMRSGRRLVSVCWHRVLLMLSYRVPCCHVYGDWKGETSFFPQTLSPIFFFFHFKPRLIFVVMKCHCDDGRACNSVASGSHFLHSESEQEAGLVDA